MRLVASLAVALGVLAVPKAQAQNQPPAYAEYRADAIVGRGTAAQGGAGVVVPLGIYVRLGIDAAAGATWRGDATRASGRVDVIGRFLLDPFRETRLGLSLGGGVSASLLGLSHLLAAGNDQHALLAGAAFRASHASKSFPNT